MFFSLAVPMYLLIVSLGMPSCVGTTHIFAMDVNMTSLVDAPHPAHL